MLYVHTSRTTGSHTERTTDLEKYLTFWHWFFQVLFLILKYYLCIDTITHSHSHAHNIISILCMFLKLMFWNFFFNLASYYNIISPYYMYLLVFSNTIFKGCSKNRFCLLATFVTGMSPPTSATVMGIQKDLELFWRSFSENFTSCTLGQGKTECSKYNLLPHTGYSVTWTIITLEGIKQVALKNN